VFLRRLLKRCEQVFRDQNDSADASMGQPRTKKLKGLLVPLHVHTAIMEEPSFDFLSNKYLGSKHSN
jgi:hypothetical protein